MPKVLPSHLTEALAVAIFQRNYLELLELGDDSAIH